MKRLLALALMLALLAIGNTAAAGPLGVNMGDPLKPDKGWPANGIGIETRKYKGSLPFDRIEIEGTRDGGVCVVRAIRLSFALEPESLTPEIPEVVRIRRIIYAREHYVDLKALLLRKYGKPSSEVQDETWWGPLKNKDKISSIVLWIDYRYREGNRVAIRSLKYFFENHSQCEKANAGEL